jgi:2-alkyl-3-oxoalkanoate reductase
VKQRVLVIGASGFIGERVTAALTACDWAQPIAASRHIERHEFDSSVERLTLDATDPVAVGRALQDTSYVVNCVAGKADVIVASGNALFSAVQQCKQSPRIVNLSSMAVYGTESRAVDETSNLPSILDPYATAKVTVENFASDYKNTVTLRPGIVYGPKSEWWSGHIARLLIAGRLGNLGENGEGICNLVYVDDVATAIVSVLRNERLAGNTINLGCLSPDTWNDYFQRYTRALGAIPVTISAAQLSYELHIVGPVIKLVEIVAKRVPGLRPAPPIRPWLTTLCRQKLLMNCGKAQHLIPIKWTSLTDGLNHSARWYQSIPTNP